MPVHELDVVELRAAADLVTSGAASRVMLANVRSRPGLLWEADEIAREQGVEILVVETRQNGTIDLSVRPAPSRDEAAAEDVPELPSHASVARPAWARALRAVRRGAS